MYSRFKDSIEIEKYLTLLPNSLRIPLLHFRTGNHRFIIETGRWTQTFIPHENRICPICNMSELGCEQHYLLYCPFFHEKRKMLIPSYFYTRPNANKFKELLSSKNYDTLHNLSIFVKHLIKHFKQSNYDV